MYSAYKLNKQDDNIQPWHTPFPIWNQSVVPCPVLTVASWPAYRFLRRWVRWSDIPICLRIFHSLLWFTQSTLWHNQRLLAKASVRSVPFLSFIMSIFAWNVPLVSLIFLKRSLVFPILLFSSISLHCSLRKAFLSLLAILWNSAFRWKYLSFSPLSLASLFSAICKASSDNHFVYLRFFFLGMVFITSSCTMLQTS